ncbi:hypothetical protein C9426_16175 [Serratia sp. S1B]|nr:hypothetical protein C9426_16175 [Serratia sp. S1B]
MNKSYLRENVALIFSVLIALIFSREIYHHFGWVLGSFALVFSTLFCFSKYKKYNVDLKISEKYKIIYGVPEIELINADIISPLDGEDVRPSPYQDKFHGNSRRLDMFISVENKQGVDLEKIKDKFIFDFFIRIQQLIIECYFIEPILSYRHGLYGFCDTTTNNTCGLQYKNMALAFPVVGLSNVIIIEYNMRDDLWYSLAFSYDGKFFEMKFATSEYKLQMEYFYKFAIELAEIWNVKLVFRNVDMN